MNGVHTNKLTMNNLGIPPLAGICSYDEACRTGYTVDHNVDLLKRYNYVITQCYFLLTAHIPQTPEWEVKSAISYHIWLDSEHSILLRKRVSEMRNPPLHMDKIPDERLHIWLDEAIRANSTLELLIGVYQVIKPEMIRSLKKHLAETNPLVDLPTCRVLRTILMEEESMVQWGEQAIQALLKAEADHHEAAAWDDHLRYYMEQAGGIAGDLSELQHDQLPTPRSDGKPYEMDVYPRRDERMFDVYNQFDPRSAFSDESRDPVERTYALVCMRIREMDVPEFMSPIIYKTRGKQWEYYNEMGRQFFDEARHAMMGEVALYQGGIPFYELPIQMFNSAAYNTQLLPLESHAVLWGIEQWLMAKETGKPYEWVVAKSAGNELVATFQDYDWADEVLHAQIGRKWLVPEFANMDEMNAFKDKASHKLQAACGQLRHLSDQEDWWTPFIARIRRQSDK